MKKMYVLLMTAALMWVGCGKAEAPAPEATAPAKRGDEAAAKPEVKKEPRALAREKASGLFAPLPENLDSEANPYTEAKAELGRALYFDKRLSKNHDISCNSCHQLDRFGVDNEPTSPGHKGVRGGRNSPTVYNAAAHLSQFWDGRAEDVEAQAKGPVLNPVEMAMPDGDAVIKVLKTIPGYVEMFKRAFPEAGEPMTYDNAAKAIGAFERRLVTPSPWDAFLKGDDDAITVAQAEGFLAFTEAGCVACHNGAAVGGASYQKMGLIKPWQGHDDTGRQQVTGDAKDAMMFKVPSLRNIAKTGPYMHDGSVAELREAVALMGELQLGKELTEAQVTSIVTWLEALTGEVPGDYVAEPELPASGPNTPPPDPS